MKGFVSIFGGVNTRARYFRHAIKIYLQYGFQVELYLSTGLKCLIPTKYILNVDRAYNRLMAENQDELNKIPKIIHISSGGIYSGLELNDRIKHDFFVMEASPFSPYNIHSLRTTIKTIVGLTLPLNTLEYTMNLLGIPTLKYQRELLLEYERLLLLLPTVVIMNGEKDMFLDKDYIKDFIIHLNTNDISTTYISFEDATHYNIAKSNMVLYVDTIESICKYLLR